MCTGTNISDRKSDMNPIYLTNFDLRATFKGNMNQSFVETAEVNTELYLPPSKATDYVLFVNYHNLTIISGRYVSY